MTEPAVPSDRTVRVVVTGHDDRDQGIVVEDRRVTPFGQLGDGYQFHLLWGTDDLPGYPDDGLRAAFSGSVPPVGGVRFAVVTVAPESAAHPPDEVDPDGYRMHNSPSLDLLTVLNGEVWLSLDSGADVLLRAGDCVVQQGSAHLWRNRSDRPVQIVCATIGVANRLFPGT